MSGTSGTYAIIAPVTTTKSADRAPPDLSPGRRGGALGDPCRRCEGQGAAGGRGARHRLRRGRAGLPDAGAHRRGRRLACRDTANHRYTPTGGTPGAPRGHRGQDPARLGLRGGGQPGAGHQRRQAGRRQRFRRAVRPGRRSPGARPVLDDLPRGHRAWPAGRRSSSPPTRPPGSAPRSRTSSAAWTPRTKALLFVSPSNPTGAVYPRRRDRGHRPAGRVEGDLGADRRDLRAPRLRRGRAPLHARPRARAGRPLPGGQRGGQDLRHDRAGGWGGSSGRPTPSAPRPTSRATRPPTWPTCRSAPRWPPSRATSTTWP